MVNRLGRKGPRDRGAVAVEFALVLPLFLLLIFGIVQYGWTFYQTQETAQAAREGARIAAVGELETGPLQTYVANQIVSSSVAASAVTVCFSEGAGGDAGLDIGDEITMRVSFPATEFNLPFLPFPNGLQIDEEARTRAEDPPTVSYPACP
jgi:Flp pilus assembly protein TadG